MSRNKEVVFVTVTGDDCNIENHRVEGKRRIERFLKLLSRNKNQKVIIKNSYVK